MWWPRGQERKVWFPLCKVCPSSSPYLEVRLHWCPVCDFCVHISVFHFRLSLLCCFYFPPIFYLLCHITILQIKGHTPQRSKGKDIWQLRTVNWNPGGSRKCLYSETPEDTQGNLHFPKTESPFPQAENENN